MVISSFVSFEASCFIGSSCGLRFLSDRETPRNPPNTSGLSRLLPLPGGIIVLLVAIIAWSSQNWGPAMISDAQRESSKLVLKEFFSLWDNRSGLYGNVLFGSAIGRGYDKKWRNVTSFLFPMHRSEVRSIGVEADYGDFKLLEGAMSLDEAKVALSNVVERDRLCLPGIPEIEIQASLHPNSSMHFQHSGPHRFPIFY